MYTQQLVQTLPHVMHGCISSWFPRFATFHVVLGGLHRQLLVPEPVGVGAAGGGIGLSQQLVLLLRPPAQPDVNLRERVHKKYRCIKAPRDIMTFCIYTKPYLGTTLFYTYTLEREKLRQMQ